LDLFPPCTSRIVRAPLFKGSVPTSFLKNCSFFPAFFPQSEGLSILLLRNFFPSLETVSFPLERRPLYGLTSFRIHRQKRQARLFSPTSIEHPFYRRSKVSPLPVEVELFFYRAQLSVFSCFPLPPKHTPCFGVTFLSTFFFWHPEQLF